MRTLIANKTLSNQILSKAVEQVDFNGAQLIYAFRYVLPLEIVRDDGFSNILERRFKDLEIDIEI